VQITSLPLVIGSLASVLINPRNSLKSAFLDSLYLLKYVCRAYSIEFALLPSIVLHSFSSSLLRSVLRVWFVLNDCGKSYCVALHFLTVSESRVEKDERSRKIILENEKHRSTVVPASALRSIQTAPQVSAAGAAPSDIELHKKEDSLAPMLFFGYPDLLQPEFTKGYYLSLLSLSFALSLSLVARIYYNSSLHIWRLRVRVSQQPCLLLRFRGCFESARVYSRCCVVVHACAHGEADRGAPRERFRGFGGRQG